MVPPLWFFKNHKNGTNIVKIRSIFVKTDFSASFVRAQVSMYDIRNAKIW